MALTSHCTALYRAGAQDCTSKKGAIVALNIIEVGFSKFSKTKSYQPHSCGHIIESFEELF